MEVSSREIRSLQCKVAYDPQKLDDIESFKSLARPSVPLWTTDYKLVLFEIAFRFENVAPDR